MDYSTSYYVRLCFDVVAVLVLVLPPALVLLWVFYMLLMNLLALLLPRCFPKTAEQRKRTANARLHVDRITHRHWQHTKRPMTRREASRKAWIIKQQVKKENLHPNKPIDRDFFKKGKKS